MIEIEKNISEIRRKIANAAQKSGRDAKTIKLVAVGKTKSSEDIRKAFATGQKVFGENYAQEMLDKMDKLADLDIEWHFIGHLQRNKVKILIDKVNFIHSLDSIKLAEEINRRANRPINCLIELNLAQEDSKSGVDEKGLVNLVSSVKDMKNINLIGLMTMPPFDISLKESGQYFSRLRGLLDEINSMEIYPKRLTELSMGMSADFEVAIGEGATIVRVGTAIFGERHYQEKNGG